MKEYTTSLFVLCYLRVKLLSSTVFKTIMIISVSNKARRPILYVMDKVSFTQLLLASDPLV